MCLATCVTATRTAVVADRRVASVGERESTWGTRIREPDDFMLHLLEREGVTVVDVGEKLFVRLLVAGGFGEVKAHERDEGGDVLDGHGLHVAELRSRGVDRSDVVKSRSHRVILETETRLEATSEELVRDRCTGDGVQKENFRQTAPPQPRRSKDATAHLHQPGARPDPPRPAPVRSVRHRPAKAKFRSPLQNRISQCQK